MKLSKTCPKCGYEMEQKGKIDVSTDEDGCEFSALVFQCSKCKNIEIE